MEMEQTENSHVAEISDAISSAEQDDVDVDQATEDAVSEVKDVLNEIVAKIAFCKISTIEVGHLSKPTTESVDKEMLIEKPEDLESLNKEEVKKDMKVLSSTDETCIENENSRVNKPKEHEKDCENIAETDFRVVEILKTIATYKTLALNKGAHSLLLKQDMLIGQLVLFLGDESEKVINAAFEVVKILYNNRNNHIALKNSLHFLEALIVVSRVSTLPRKVREDARKIHDIVKSSKPPLSQTNNSRNVNAAQPTQPHASGPSQDNNQSNISHRSGRDAIKANRSRNNDRETIVSINPTVLHQAIRRQEITVGVVKIKGIISVTYNLNRNHCIIRAKPHVPPEVFGKTIANLGIECYLVRRENKEEVLLKMEPDHKLENNLSSLEQENVPSYLPDDDDDEDEYLNKNDMVARGDEEAPNTVSGKISSFFRKSFFW